MIPNKEDIISLWDTYNFPQYKRIHCDMVRRVALILSTHIKKQNPSIFINEQLLEAAALLHDLDKNIPRLPGEHHPDTVIRILIEHGMTEVAEVVRTHPLHMILDSEKGPKTIEQQLLYLSDKTTKQEFIGVAKRFMEWDKEDTDEMSKKILTATRPKVLELQNEILQKAGISEEELSLLIK